MSFVPPSKPARKVVTGRKRNSVSGYVPVPAPKGTGLVAFESLNEEKLVVLMRDDTSISRMWGQPETFTWKEAATGRTRRYTPDFLIECTDGTRAYREVKPFDELLADPDFDSRRAAIDLECRSRGAKFEVWTDREIGGVDPFIRVATEVERRLFGLADAADLVEPEDGLFHASAAVARELGVARGMMQEEFWVGLAELTGLITAIRPKPLPVPRWARTSR